MDLQITVTSSQIEKIKLGLALNFYRYRNPLTGPIVIGDEDGSFEKGFNVDQYLTTINLLNELHIITRGSYLKLCDLYENTQKAEVRVSMNRHELVDSLYLQILQGVSLERANELIDERFVLCES